MARPERYQLPLLVELGGQPAAAPTLEARAAFNRLYPAQEGQSRFVRSVQEEVVIRSPADAAVHLLNHVYTPFDQFDQEELWTLLLNTKNRVTHEVLVYRGTLDTIPVRLAELFKEAIRVNAASLLLSHCHPSGEPAPSPQDVQLTEQAIQVGELLGMPLLDHVVIGRNQWLSMRERGLAFPTR